MLNLGILVHKLITKTTIGCFTSVGDQKQLTKTIESFCEKNPTFKIVSIYFDSSNSVHIVFEVENNFHFLNNGCNTYAVLSAWHNGIADRTTYNGLHMGSYDHPTLEDALEVARGRCKGGYDKVDLFFNLPKELQFLPDKYKKMVASDSYHEGKNGGYWIYLKPEYFNEEMNCQTIHEYSQKSVLKVIRSSRPITSEDKKQANYK